jgi:hypothetical protein
MIDTACVAIGCTVLQLTPALTNAERATLAVYFMAATAAWLILWGVIDEA